jgi:hypothetical protein
MALYHGPLRKTSIHGSLLPTRDNHIFRHNLVSADVAFAVARGRTARYRSRSAFAIGNRQSKIHN